LSQAIKSNIPDFKGNFDTMIEIMRTEIRTNGFASLKNTGRDDLFIVPTNKLETNTDELSVNGDQSAKSIARCLTKHLNNKMTSRVLLNKFIGYVA
jgi:phosphatidylinositol kinase/protein kinase (PI-3  family)